MSASYLTLDLFAGPACRLDSSRRKFAVLACVLDHGGEPVLAIKVLKLAVGKSISKVTANVSLAWKRNGERNLPNDAH